MAGIPEGVINVLPGSGSVCGQAIADHPKVSTIQIGPRAFRHSVVIQCVSSAKVPIALPSSLPPSFHPCSPFLGIATVIKSLTPSGKTTDEDQRRTCKSAITFLLMPVPVFLICLFCRSRKQGLPLTAMPSATTKEWFKSC